VVQGFLAYKIAKNVVCNMLKTKQTDFQTIYF